MSPYLITGLAAALLGAAIGAGGAYKIDAAALAREQAAHARDNAAHAAALAQINADSAKALSDALVKQQAAEGKVASIETQFNTEVENHAKDSLQYRADLAAGTQRLRVRVASCGPSAASSESTAAAVSADAAATYADINPTTASSVFRVAADDQAEIDKLTALQAYVKSLQDEGFIAK